MEKKDGSEIVAQKLTRKDTNKNPADASRATNSKVRIKAVDDFIDSMLSKYNDFTESERVRVLSSLGTGEEYFTCQYCGKIRYKSDFYCSSEPYNNTKVTRMCKSCAAEFAVPKVNGVPQKPTKDTVKKACCLLNKPFLDKVYEDSLEAINKTTSKMVKGDVWKEYIKNIAMPAFNSLDYSDSDDFTHSAYSLEVIKNDGSDTDKLILQEYGQNKKDAIRLLGYDPFMNEPELDKPYMYSNLIGYLDNEDGDNMDRMKLSSIIEIIKGFNHRDKLNDVISVYLKDTNSMNKNLATIKVIEETKKNIGIDIKNLAAESKISLSSNKTANKESSTFTGKLKMLKEKKLRDQEENVYDYKTCEGVRQIAEYSAEGLLNRISIDEAVSADIIIDQRRMLSKFKYAFEDSMERARLLFRENQDLKDRLKEIDPQFEECLKEIPYEYQIREKDEFDELVDVITNYKAIDMEELLEEDSGEDEEVESEEDGEDYE